MVFGWGKKKKVEYDEPVENVTSISQTITLDEIPKILDDMVTVSYTHLTLPTKRIV